MASLPLFTSRQYNYRALQYLSHSVESQMLYEDSSVRRTAKLDFFMTALLKCPYILSYYYIVLVQVKGIETII